ncbi:fasciclin domain-containing protein [Longitalea luteola]|uniref:fasciclin domain-containing protein n=1 Tax=Longitalea luteola TaxID=2812563 RepID=UPI001A95D98C|nr:fasciclin domain-containing protein [Longitalea luteola]
MKKYIPTSLLLSCCMIIAVWLSGCKKVAIVVSTTTDVNIFEYLTKNPEKYSDLVKIIEKSGYNGFLNAYGSYTMFAPTNDGIKGYLTERNLGSVDQITEQEAINIVKLHLMSDTLTSSSFKDGKLPTVTMYGQYLITSVNNENGVSNYTVNRRAIIQEPNIRTGNGYVHTIDHVLLPATKTLAQLVSENNEYSIFKQALEATGFYDSLNTINLADTTRRWLTLFAETNSALADSGIHSYHDLYQKYCHTGKPDSVGDSLHIYVAYHIIPDAKYLADIVSSSSHTTLAPLEVLASKLDGERVLLNDINFNGVHEPGVEIQRTTSDVSATNGVLHTSLGHFSPKVRLPVPIYWDVADFPEVRKLPAVFRKASYSFTYGSIKDINWDKTTNNLDYSYTTSGSIPVFYNDHLSIPMGNTSRHFWIDFTSPIIVKGRYKVWICYRTAKQSGSIGQPGGSNMPVQVFFDGQAMSRTFNFTERRPNLSDGELEALGWKKYSPTAEQLAAGKYLGIIDVPTTDRHVFRLQALPGAGTGQNSNFLDMIHIIPVNMNQYLPRFARDGTLVDF